MNDIEHETTGEWKDRLPAFEDDPALWADTKAVQDMPDRRIGAIYDLPEDLHLAVVVALITGRPLLLRGEPGSGKSSLAAYVARSLDWRYYEKVVTSATRAEDFLWRFDAVQRLADAQARQAGDPALDPYDYIEPGVLWWVLAPDSAAIKGRDSKKRWPKKKQATEPLFEEVNERRLQGHAVVLIDELDKADPDVPNGLLVPLGSGQFRVTETDTQVIAEEGESVESGRSGGGEEDEAIDIGRLLVVITTNEERQLPPAFVRRCVVYSIRPPSQEKLIKVARLHVNGPPGLSGTENEEEVFSTVAERLLKIREELAGHERKPSIAEYLDAVKACLEFGVTPRDESAAWKAIEKVALVKRSRPGEDEGE